MIGADFFGGFVRVWVCLVCAVFRLSASFQRNSKKQCVCGPKIPGSTFTASAPLAIINTASKHLHNDLARAIKALEQKKKGAR